MCPSTSGIISNILLLVNDENATLYPSGKVNAMVFQNLNVFNGIMGTCFSGNVTDACISPEISGTPYQGVLEMLVAKELTKNTLYNLARNNNITSFREGDSAVTLANNAEILGDFYKQLVKDFDKLVADTKYSIVSKKPSSIQGTDSGIQESLPPINVNYRPYEY